MYKVHKLNAQVKVQVLAQKNTLVQVEVPFIFSAQVKVVK